MKDQREAKSKCLSSFTATIHPVSFSEYFDKKHIDPCENSVGQRNNETRNEIEM
jgi:hypothetical protein